MQKPLKNEYPDNRYFSYYIEQVDNQNVIEGLTTQKEVVIKPGVAGTLHIVLATQRMQARAGLADLAGHRRQSSREDLHRVLVCVADPACAVRDLHPHASAARQRPAGLRPSRRSHGQ